MAKKIMKKKIARKKTAAALKGIAKVAARAEIKKIVPGTEELIIEQAKFSQPQPLRAAATKLEGLPDQYDRDRIILQVRDPWWIHAYWELKGSTVQRLKRELKDGFYKAKWALRVYDVSQIIFNGRNAHRFFDIHINAGANNWYIETGGPGRSWCVDLGLLLPDGRFITIVRSNVVHTPIEGPSWITDEEWMIPDDMFRRLYGLGFGSSPLGKAWRQRMAGSGGIASMASPVKKPQEKKFWLNVDCELIVYGATDPRAKVTVQNKPINLRPDGTFTLRLALPNGRQAVAIKARSCDKTEERSITPIVTRETK